MLSFHLLLEIISYTLSVVDASGQERVGKVGMFSSLVADGDQVGIVYYAERDLQNVQPIVNGLRFAWKSNGNWQSVNLPVGGGNEPSMVRRSDGTYQIVFRGEAGLQLVSGLETQWILSDLRVDSAQTPASPSNVSLAIDSNDRLHIAYFDSSREGQGALKYTRFDGETWMRGESEFVATNVWRGTLESSHSMLALDSDGVPHIIFSEPSNEIDSMGSIQYASFQNGTWSIESIGAFGMNPILSFGPNNEPRIVFYNSNSLVYGAKQNGFWSFETIETDEHIYSPSLSLDHLGNSYVAYGMTNESDLFLSMRTRSGRWVSERIASGGQEILLGRNGCSLKVDSSGALHLSFARTSTFELANGFWDYRSDLNYFSSPTSVINCPADFNQSGLVGVQDIFDFLRAHAEGNSSADFDQSGNISIQDIFDFLTAYFAGCS